MNIHEYQAKSILKQFGIKVPNGIPVFKLSEMEKKFEVLISESI